MKTYLYGSKKKNESKADKIDRIIREKLKTIYQQNCSEPLIMKYYGDMKFVEDSTTDIMKEICGKQSEIPVFDREYPAIEFEDRTYTATRLVIRNIIKDLNNGLDPFKVFMKKLDNEESNHWMETLIEIFRLKKEGNEYHDLQVQEQIKNLHDIVKEKISESIFLFSMYNLYGAPGTETAQKLDFTYGRDSAKFLYLAWRYYCINQVYNETDLDLMEDVYAIFYLADCKNTADSDDVQEYVRGLKLFLSTGIGICDEDQALRALYVARNTLSSMEFKDMYDGGEPTGIIWFFGKALECYIYFLEFVKTIDKSLGTQ